jgi:hypothetical protein
MGSYAGVDWATDKHDVLVADEAGGQLPALDVSRARTNPPCFAGRRTTKTEHRECCSVAAAGLRLVADAGVTA